VTSLPGDPQDLYDRVYCARGEMENRIKEQQLGLFSDRTSCHAWWANQFRVLLSACAYVLLETIRRVGLAGDGAGAGAGDDDPPEVAQDRDGDRAQHAPHPGLLQHGVPVSGAVPARLRDFGSNVTRNRRCPGAARSMGVGGGVARPHDYVKKAGKKRGAGGFSRGSAGSGAPQGGG
jgi:hypothetical protein